MLVDFITLVATFIAVGSFLDQVIIGPQERENIAKYLVSANKNDTIDKRFTNFLETSHSIVFGRFFSNGFNSRSFVFSTFVLSVTSFLIVATTQLYFYNGSIREMNFDVLQLGLIFFFIIANFLFDYLTIIQTKIFVEAAVKANNIFKAAILIFSDLIVTMNTFILFYAFVILLVVQFFAWSSATVNFYRTKSLNSSAEKLESIPKHLISLDDGSVFSRLKYTGTVSGLLESTTYPAEPESIYIPFDTTLNPEEIDIERLILTATTKMSISMDEQFQEITDERRLKIARDLQTKTGLNRLIKDQPEVDDEDLPPVEGIKIKINRRISSLRDFDLAYSEAYRQSDILEDGFPMSLIADLGVISLDRFMADTISSSDKSAPVAICILEGGSWVRFEIDKSSVEHLYSCKNYIIIGDSWKYFLTRKLSTVDRNLDDRLVPYNTLLITSLLPTGLFYLVIILFAIITRLLSSFIVSTARFRKYILRAPFAVASFFISIPFYIFSTWT